jgi:prepilin-type N-terminal cleavage/methylation domain-containing protein
MALLQSLKSTGFTIIELLIVIVIIGILASITIVSYSGVTQRTNNTSAEQAAQSAAGKLETYNSTTGSFPYDISALTSDPSAEYYIAPAVATFTLATTQPDTTIEVKYIKCGTTPNAAQSDIAVGNANITGARVHYWTYTGTPNADSYVSAGNDIGTGVACPAS